jgi:hypothetical protein
VLISVHCDIGEVAVHAKFYQRSKPMKCVLGEVWCRQDCILQLVVISMEDDIGLPLLVHVAGVPQRIELQDQWFEGFNLGKSGTLW